MPGLHMLLVMPLLRCTDTQARVDHGNGVTADCTDSQVCDHTSLITEVRRERYEKVCRIVSSLRSCEGPPHIFAVDWLMNPWARQKLQQRV